MANNNAKSYVKFIIPLAIVCLMFFVLLYYLGLLSGAQAFYYKVYYKITRPEKDVQALIKLHQATKVKKNGVYTYDYTIEDRKLMQSDSAKCIACHGNMLALDKNNKPKYPIHRKMLVVPMLNFACTDCHKQVDIWKRVPGRATITVDRKLCPQCHNVSITGGGGRETPLADKSAPDFPRLLVLHGTDHKSDKEWLSKHPRVAMSLGVSECRKCHIPGSELDFCNDCHLRGGFMPASHQALYNVPINRIYPKAKVDKNKGNVITKWKGFHFVFVREVLNKMGVKDVSARKLPLDKIENMPCGACHEIKDWCTRCHIKHQPNWLSPDGHPAYIIKHGTNYCFKCHDTKGAKCLSCHSYVGTVK